MNYLHALRIRLRAKKIDLVNLIEHTDFEGVVAFTEESYESSPVQTAVIFREPTTGDRTLLVEEEILKRLGVG